MQFPGVKSQGTRHPLYPADGSIASGSAPQLVLPEHPSRSVLRLQNTSSAVIWVGVGSARGTCSISNGQVTPSFTITNAGFGFTRPPKIEFLGGGFLPQYGVNPANTSYVGAPGPAFPAATRVAQATAVLTGGKVTSIQLNDPGLGYVVAPLMFFMNDPLDPNGCFDPSVGGGSGYQLYPSLYLPEESLFCTTDPVALFCATASSTYSCGYAP